MAKHLIDTDLYIDLIQSGTTLSLIRELYDKDAPGIYFSSIVGRGRLIRWVMSAYRRRANMKS